MNPVCSVVVDQAPPEIPKRFSSWEALRRYVLQNEPLDINWLPEKEISAEISARTAKARKEFQSNPDTFYNL